MTFKKNPAISKNRKNDKTLLKEEITNPIILRNENGNIVEGLMIDETHWKNNQCSIQGWCIGEPAFEIDQNGAPLKYEIERLKRPDVAKEIGLQEPDGGFGFLLTATSSAPQIGFAWSPYTLRNTKHRKIYELLIKRNNIEQPLQKPINTIPSLAYIEVASWIPNIETILISGWALGTNPLNIFLQSDDLPPVKIHTAHVIYRKDVFDAFGHDYAAESPLPGFITYKKLNNTPKRIRLLVTETTEINNNFVILCEKEVSVQRGSPHAIFQWLTGIFTPTPEIPKRYSKIDIPIIEALLKKDRASWPHLPIHKQTFGSPPAAPEVSIIIPLYGRSDFVEHQLIEFSRDIWLLKNCEIIYVIDDLNLLDSFMTLSRNLYQLYRVSFTWVFGTANRGFSGANNLGASIASGKYFLFLNSDAFPNTPGWLQKLIATLDESPQNGAVAPKLLHFDGSIQHASMTFEYRSDLGFYINHHPYMGLDPELDPHTKPTAVPAVTGACVLLRKKHFTQVGGWDTCYLIGDFEDSDLCLKLRAEGLRSVYEPRVQLTHLERQSFKLVGENDFRSRVVAYNATRHQMRWAHALATLADQPAL